MTKEILLEKGFVKVPHLFLENYELDISRRRFLGITNLGTPTEMVFLLEKEKSQITDIICIHNYDYDGFLTESKLNNILSIFIS